MESANQMNPQLRALLDQHVLYRKNEDEYIIPKFREFCIQLNSLINQKAYMGEVLKDAEELIDRLMQIDGVQLSEPDPEFTQRLAEQYPEIAKDIGLTSKDKESPFETKD